MKLKYIVYGIISFSLIVGWNAFLVHRDSELFKVHNQKVENLK